MKKTIYAIIAAAGLMTSCSPEKPVDGRTGPANTDAPINVSQLEFPMSDIKLLYAQPFTVEQPFRHNWHSQPQEFRQGTLIVLETDKDYTFPRNSLEPVLYAGTKTVQRLNRGFSGRVIGIIPGDEGIKDTPIWYGDPELPERLTDDAIISQFQKASAAGLQNISQDVIDSVTVDPVRSIHLSEYLREHAADVVMRFSPQEESLAKAWRLSGSGPELQ